MVGLHVLFYSQKCVLGVRVSEAILQDELGIAQLWLIAVA